jgi:predicted dehydrogenase
MPTTLEIHYESPLVRPSASPDPPRLLIIGAGCRGNDFARAIKDSSNGIIVGVVEPIASRREQLGAKYIWNLEGPADGQEFVDWKDFMQWETLRRARAERGEDVPTGVDGVLVCVQDNLHEEVVVGLAPLRLHLLCEKPLAPTLQACLRIYQALAPISRDTIFAVGHVLRYSPHNLLLRQLIDDDVIGEVTSMEHTEPVGWWHFAHSYVR